MFGGVPIKVAIPPIFAAQATLRRIGRANLSRCSGSRMAITLEAMGNIIMAVAVFDIHMDMNAVASIKPASN